jgi:hypothetical protein
MRTNLLDCYYFYEDIDISESIKRKAKVVAAYISQSENIPIEEAYVQYINSEHFAKIEDPETHMWSKSEQEVVMDYIKSKKEQKQVLKRI